MKSKQIPTPKNWKSLINALELKVTEHFEERIKIFQKTDNDFFEIKNKNEKWKLEVPIIAKLKNFDFPQIVGSKNSGVKNWQK